MEWKQIGEAVLEPVKAVVLVSLVIITAAVAKQVLTALFSLL